MKTFLHFTEQLAEVSNPGATIAALHRLADRPGTPEEGQNARARATELTRKHFPAGVPSPQSAAPSPTVNQNPNLRHTAHPLHNVATRFGYKHVESRMHQDPLDRMQGYVEHHYEHPRTLHKLDITTDYDHENPYRPYSHDKWQHSTAGPNTWRGTSLQDHLRRLHG